MLWMVFPTLKNIPSMLVNYDWRARQAGPTAMAVSSKGKINNMLNVLYSEFQSILHPKLSSLVN